MREIKFRAFDKRNNEMLSWEYIDQLDKDGIEHFMDIVKDQNYEVMQYTGLKDKNGFEIYEGDIIKSNRGHTATVEWDEDNGRFLAFTATRRIMYVGQEPAVEVIGNIHEHQHLLKEGEKVNG